MGKQPYLAFSLRDELFAIAAGAVRELFRLPELTPVEEAPSYIAGVLNLRKKIIPVTDLNLLFGHDRRKYLLTDSVIVFESAEEPSSAECGMRSAELKEKTKETSAELKNNVRDTLHEIRCLGLIVNEIHDVIEISAEDIEPPPFYLNSALPTPHSALEKSRQHFIASEARIGEDIVMILNPDKLMQYSESGAETLQSADSALPNSRRLSGIPHSAFADMSPEEREIFHKRAVNLMPAAEEEGLAGLMPMAVVSLGGEYFGMDLELVREFSDIPDLTPIPCCPGHILGNMNLRGNVLTVIDISELLNLPNAECGMRSAEFKTKDSALRTPHSALEGKVIVAATGGLSAGIAVDEVFDVIYLNPSDLKPVPSAVRTDTEQYLKGTAAYNSKVMTIIDLKKILEREELVVNEEA